MTHLNIDRTKAIHSPHNVLEGWTFRERRIGDCCWEVDGMDIYGRTVARVGTDPHTLMEDCMRQAEELAKHPSI